MATIDGWGEAAAELDELNTALGETSAIGAAFAGELSKMQSAMAGAALDAGKLTTGFSSGLKGAIDGLVLGGETLSEAFRGLARSMADTVYAAALKPVTQSVGSLLAEGVAGLFGAVTASAMGNGFSQGRVMPFAAGGVVTAPTAFAMRGGTGLMGEAGPEAILPLARGADGRLGVHSGGGGAPVAVTFNITTPDVAGFARSQSQIAAQMSRALQRGQRNR